MVAAKTDTEQVVDYATLNCSGVTRSSGGGPRQHIKVGPLVLSPFLKGVLIGDQPHRLKERREIAFRRAAVLLFGGLLVGTRGFPRTTVGQQTVGYLLLSLVFALVIARVVADHLSGGGWVGALFSASWLRGLRPQFQSQPLASGPQPIATARSW